MVKVDQTMCNDKPILSETMRGKEIVTHLGTISDMSYLIDVSIF